MLITPLGPIKLYVNDKEIEYTAVSYIKDEHCLDLNGRYIIQYEYKAEYKKQIIKCCLPEFKTESDDIESGERVEAISFYKDFSKLTIGIEAQFGLEEEYGYDYSGSYLPNGIAYETDSGTMSQTLLFAISWITPVTEENDFQTTHGSDATIMNARYAKYLKIDNKVVYMWHDIVMKLARELDQNFSIFKGIAVNYFESPVKLVIELNSQEPYLPHNHQNEIKEFANEIINNYLLTELESKYTTYEFVFDVEIPK